jgi:hypothetical protein
LAGIGPTPRVWMSGVEKEVKETALNITGKTGDEVVVKGAKNAYAIAKSGGKHSGFYKQLNKSPDEIRKAINSIK